VVLLLSLTQVENSRRIAMLVLTAMKYDGKVTHRRRYRTSARNCCIEQILVVVGLRLGLGSVFGYC